MIRPRLLWNVATEPLTPRAGDWIVLWTCLLIGIAAFLLNVGAFGA